MAAALRLRRLLLRRRSARRAAPIPIDTNRCNAASIASISATAYRSATRGAWFRRRCRRTTFRRSCSSARAGFSALRARSTPSRFSQRSSAAIWALSVAAFRSTLAALSPRHARRIRLAQRRSSRPVRARRTRFVRRRAGAPPRREPPAFLAALTLIEPHLGLPVCAAMLLWVPRSATRAPGNRSLCWRRSRLTSAPPEIVEYVLRVLPAQAAAETGYVYQYSLTYLLRRARRATVRGVGGWRARYVAVLALGVWLGRRGARNSATTASSSRSCRPPAASSAALTCTWSICRSRYPRHSCSRRSLRGARQERRRRRALPARGSVDPRLDCEETFSRDAVRRGGHPRCGCASARPSRSRRSRRSPQRSISWSSSPPAPLVAATGTFAAGDLAQRAWADSVARSAAQAPLARREGADVARARGRARRFASGVSAIERRRRNCAVGIVIAVLALAALRDVIRLGDASPWRNMDDFPDFYCAGWALNAKRKPVPLRAASHVRAPR